MDLQSSRYTAMEGSTISICVMLNGSLERDIVVSISLNEESAAGEQNRLYINANLKKFYYR